MRYYKIEVLADDGSPYATFTSHPGGAVDMNALHVEMDIFAAPYAAPAGSSWVRIWGVPIDAIAQPRDFNGKQIRVSGGMQKGLPLANPAQAGLLVGGRIFQGFGNWIGTSQSLEFVLRPDDGTLADPANLVLNWPKDTDLAGPLKAMLSAAFPGRTVTVNIGAELKQARSEVGFWETLPQFAAWLKQKTHSLRGGDYRGVDIVASGLSGSIRAYDAGGAGDAGSPVEIAFTDLIGQPTWIGPATIQVTCVMRGDIGVGDYIKLPPTAIITTPQSQAQARQSSVFQGSLQVVQQRHVGASRTPDPAAWVTVIDAVSAT